MSVPAQRQYKTDQIAEAFQKNGFRVIKTVDSTISHSAGEHDESDTSDDDDEDYVIAVKPCLGNDQVYGYRSKLTPHYYSQIPPTLKQQQATNEVDGGAESNKQQQVLGFQKLFSRQIVDVETCPIATDRVNQAYAELRKQIPLQSTSAASKTPSMLIDAATNKRKATDANHKKNKKQPYSDW
jgi:tRNA/tmRNA/rRNA uracil-C5-methylase (TrmA/RlmC/RlmD family)